LNIKTENEISNGAKMSIKVREISIPFFILAVCLAISFAYAKDGEGARIQGKIVSSETGEPLPRVRVTIENTDMEIITDLDGQYEIDGVPEGEYKLEVSKPGYGMSVVTGVEVKGSETTQIDIALAPEAVQLGKVEVTARRSLSTVAGLISSQRRAATIGASISSE
jgi:hypothetical protein